MKILAITDRRIMGADPKAEIRAVMERFGDRVTVQIRERDLDGRELFAWVEAVLPAARMSGSKLFVSSRADVVRCFGPEVGVHLPESGLPIDLVRAFLPEGTPIGASAHDAEGAADKLGRGADLVTVSPLFETPSKPGARALGLDGLAAILQQLPAAGRARIYALGGIDLLRAEEVLATGVGGVAAIRSAWRA